MGGRGGGRSEWQCSSLPSRWTCAGGAEWHTLVFFEARDVIVSPKEPRKPGKGLCCRERRRRGGQGRRSRRRTDCRGPAQVSQLWVSAVDACSAALRLRPRLTRAGCLAATMPTRVRGNILARTPAASLASGLGAPNAQARLAACVPQPAIGGGPPAQQPLLLLLGRHAIHLWECSHVRLCGAGMGRPVCATSLRCSAPAPSACAQLRPAPPPPPPPPPGPTSGRTARSLCASTWTMAC